MSRVLVIGGYGGFGARLTRRLLDAGHQVIVAGRSAAKGKAFCAGLSNCEPAVADRDGDVSAVLGKLRPDMLIDAAGPFQGSSYAVAEACIAHGVDYLDLADAREFVCGISKLDEAAKAAGVVVISGASTVPSLSSAVALHLSRGFDHVDTVEMALSTATFSTATASVVGAGLSYLGRKLPGGGCGWQGLRRRRYRVAGRKPLSRWVAQVDVPDLEQLPRLLPGEPAVEFRAGTDVSLHMLALWLASWPARWGWLPSLVGHASRLAALQRATALRKGDRSAMEVRLRGQRGSKLVERSWTLIAEDFDGPEIPTMAAALLADDIAAGKIGPGARTGAGLLALERFEPAFAPLAIECETTEEEEAPWLATTHRPASLRSA
jgi:NAD(P)-dependent dehydrogenase (short-subunit alcohol dehydrogenase family)